MTSFCTFSFGGRLWRPSFFSWRASRAVPQGLRNDCRLPVVYLTRAGKTCKKSGEGSKEGWRMKEESSIGRVVVAVLLAIFVVVFILPLVLKALGLTFGIIGFLFGILVWLALKLIYLAIIAAIIYLIMVVIRAVLK